jgi:N-acyl-D-aspartate/D-glutamate deacylase
MAYDLVIRGGTLVDGTGADRCEADVAIAGNRIAEVGKIADKGRREIDATGQIVTPGFVDIHTHLDAQIAWDPIASSSCYHGVTSAVLGNCGVTFAPCKPQDREYLADLMESVEDIPAASIRQGMNWNWESYGDYLRAVDDMPKGINVGGMVGHCAVRFHAMGERSLDEHTIASEADIKQMTALVDEAIGAGALGFSTSRTYMHKVPDGRCVPGTFAEPEELLAIGRVLGKRGRGVFEAAPRLGEGDKESHLPKTRAEIAWMGELSRENKVNVTFGLLHSNRRPDLYQRVIEFTEEENAAGANLRPQTTARGVGGLFALDHRTPFAESAGWRKLQLLPPGERVRALEDATLRAELCHLDQPVPIDLGMAYVLLDGAVHYAHDPDNSLVAHGQRRNLTPVEAFVQLNREHNGRVVLYFPGLNQSMEAIEDMISNPTVAMGLADSGAHVGQIMDASSPTWLLQYWVRERNVLSLEEAVRGWTSDTARLFGIADRGELRPGAFADINVIDLENLSINLPEYHHDFPGGAGRYVQTGNGYRHMIVNGQPFMEQGQHTGALAGTTLRS